MTATWSPVNPTNNLKFNPIQITIHTYDSISSWKQTQTNSIYICKIENYNKC